MMELQYVRTDRNGTKYYHDWQCPRCGGAGEADNWWRTGRICYACGGSGKRAKPLVVKEYTDEYAAKLEAKRVAKEAKRAAEVAKYNEEHAEEIAEANRRCLIFRYKQYGCGPDGVGYALLGNTYPIKDQIKANGGRWIYGAWVCPVEMHGDGITAHKIDLAGHVSGGSVEWLDDFNLYDAIHG